MDSNEIRYDNQKIKDVEISDEIRKAFLETIDKGYSLLNNQCSMAVQKALNAAGIKTQVDYNYSPMGAPAMYSSRAQYNPYLPSVAYRAIIANNPNGIYIKKR